jgi:uncharacterized protein (TIGR03790 family)
VIYPTSPFELKIEANYSFPKGNSSHDFVLIRDGVFIAASKDGNDWKFINESSAFPGINGTFSCDQRKCWIRINPAFGKFSVGYIISNNPPKFILPKLGIEASELAIIVNELDNQSIEVAQYYQLKRSIPSENIIRVRLPLPIADDIGVAAFNATRAQILAATRANIKAYAITWLRPWRVGGTMSITSAIAFGYDLAWGGWTGTCSAKKDSPFYPSQAPLYYGRYMQYDDFYVNYNGKMLNYFEYGNGRPTIAITGVNKQEAFALIDRGVASDGMMPNGTGYLMETTDSARTVRSRSFSVFEQSWNDIDGFNLRYIPLSESTNGVLRNRNDTLLYMTGYASVPDIKKNRYLPGAIADHLTSYGGMLTGQGQMSILRWLEAGATGSCGTVVEPCNYPGKFLEAQRLLTYYFLGRTMIESMWASVDMPGEAIFVGEPLASPFKGAKIEYDSVSKTLAVSVSFLFPNQRYTVEAADSETGPFFPVFQNVSTSKFQMLRIVINNAEKPFYRIRRQ